jgi:hypothetical protein
MIDLSYFLDNELKEYVVKIIQNKWSGRQWELAGVIWIKKAESWGLISQWKN